MESFANKSKSQSIGKLLCEGWPPKAGIIEMPSELEPMPADFIGRKLLSFESHCQRDSFLSMSL